jgi:glucose/arabinose dehydrogenase
MHIGPGVKANGRRIDNRHFIYGNSTGRLPALTVAHGVHHNARMFCRGNAGVLVCGLVFAALGARAQDLDTVRVASGLANPLYATYAPGDPNRLFILEQNSGDIEILNLQTGIRNATPFLTVPGMSTGGENGLLGLAFDPSYASNGLFYVNYTDSAGNIQISRYQVSGNADLANAASATPVINIPHPVNSNHNGGWLGFGPDGYLYASTGDGGSGNDPPNNAQTITNQLLGKMLRLDIRGDAFLSDPLRNYAIPATNPFVGVTGDDEIWAYGLRNVWRPSFDRLTGDLYLADVGQGAWEEINFQSAGSAGGQNYGWRVMEGNHSTGLGGGPPPFDPSFTGPIFEYNHPGGASRSITGGYVYRGSAIPGLQGTYFFADFITGQIWSFRYENGVMTQFTDRTAELAPGVGSIGNIASFGENANGELYIIDYDGEIYVMVPEPSRIALFGLGGVFLLWAARRQISINPRTARK